MQKIKVFLSKKYKNFLFRMFAKELLFKFDDAMKCMGCEYWLDYGTLLGAIRNRGFIKHDEDLDFGVLYDNKMIVESNIHNYGFKMFAKSFIENGRGEIHRFIYKGVTFDIYYYTIDNETKAHCYSFRKIPGEDYSSAKKQYVLVERYDLPFNGLRNISLFGRTFKAPSNTEEYLITLYGTNYLIPDSSFSMENMNYFTRYTKEQMIGYKLNLQ